MYKRQVPKQIDLTGDGVRISWTDDRTCIYPYRYLRLQCACAACVEEMTGRQILNISSVPEDVIFSENIEGGKYAIQFLWTDGHSTGIYPFEMLLRLAAIDNSVICESS